MKNVFASLSPERRSLSQKELIVLLGVSRQSVAVWTRAGMPRGRDGTYSLPDVLRWLRVFYRRGAAAVYEKRLSVMRKKLTRNCRQQLRFLSGGKTE